MNKVERIIPFVIGYVTVCQFYYHINGLRNSLSELGLLASFTFAILFASSVVKLSGDQNGIDYFVGAAASAIAIIFEHLLFRQFFAQYVFIVVNVLVLGMTVLSVWLYRVTSSERRLFAKHTWICGLATVMANVVCALLFSGVSTSEVLLWTARILALAAFSIMVRNFYLTTLYKKLV